VKFFQYIRLFFSFFWKLLDGARRLVLNTIFFLLVAVVVTSLLVDSTPQIAPNSVLILNPSGVLVEEQESADPTQTLLHSINQDHSKPDESRLQDVIDAIRHAASDIRIDMMIIDPQYLQGCDTSKLLEIGAAIRAFKESGKPVLAYATAYTQGQYLLASYADKIYVNPLGGVAITGYGIFQTYFKSLLDKTKINFHVFRVGDYKSAVEPFVRDSMSPEAREANRQWLGTLWRTYTGETAHNRNLSPSEISGYVDNIDTNLQAVGGNAAKMALNSKLVDEVVTEDQFDQTVGAKTGASPNDAHRLEYRDYLHRLPASKPTASEVVGIIRARGAIVPGHEAENMIGSQTLAELFQEARDDSSIAAVVLRIDSPGGSATASEEIYRQIQLTRDAGKPVVVSMGSLAASGAYWIASGANRIVASPTTLTGSIGIFAAFPTFEQTAQALGVSTDGLGTTSIADLGNPLRPIPEKTRASIQHLLQFGYDTFLERVSHGRGLTLDEARQSANGRVWTGQEAFARKLVDQLGSLDDAVKAAAEMVGLPNAPSKDIKRQLTPREAFLQSLTSAALPRIELPHSLNRLLAMLEAPAALLETFTDPNHLYARSLECEALIR